MGDIFDQFGGDYESQRKRRAQERLQNLSGGGNDFLAERDELRAARTEGTRQRDERARQLKEQHGFNFTVSQYAALADALDKKIIGEDQAYDVLAAQTISDNFKRQGINIDPLEISENLPAFMDAVFDLPGGREFFTGRPEGQSARTPKSNLAAVRGAFVTAAASMRKNFLGMQLADARSNNDAELEKTIRKRLQLEDQTIEEYGDYQKRNFFVEAGKFAAQSSMYTAFVIAGGMLGGAPGAFAAGWAGATGQAYLGLDAAGVDHKIAGPLSIAMGAVNAAIESTLGNAAGLVGRVTGANSLQASISKRAAAFVSNKLHLSGAALKMATGPAARYILESAGEMSEEVFQEIGDIIGTELAAFLQEEGVQLDRGDYINRVVQAAKGGFMASLFMGIPGLAIDTVGRTSDYKALRTDADTIPSEQMFKERHKDSPLRGDMTDEEWGKELSKIHEGRQGMREREEARAAEELEAGAGLGEGFEERKTNKDTGEEIPLGKIYRRKNGRLYTQVDKKRGLFKIGDGRIDGKNNLYAYFDYELGDDGETVRVKKFAVSSVRPELDTEKFRQEAWSDFTEAFAGIKPVWEAETTRDAEIIAELEKNNPYGNGLNYYPEALNENIADEVADTAANDTATGKDGRQKRQQGATRGRDDPGAEAEAKMWEDLEEWVKSQPEDKQQFFRKAKALHDEVEREEQAFREAQQKLRDTAAQEDMAAQGDTAQAARMKLRFGEQMARHLPGSTEASRSGAVRLVDRIGRSYGYTFDKFIEKLNLDPDNLFTHKPGKAVEAENAMAAQFAKEGESPQKVRGALQPWKRLDADMKAVQYSIVYLDPAHADYSTVIHELKHAVDNFLEKTDPKLFKRMMDAAGEYDPKNSGGMDENTWRRERSAYAFETYLQTGQAPTAELLRLFRHLKEWLKDIVNYLNGMRRLTPKQKEVFDELLSKADKVAADWDAAESARIAQEGQGQAAAANDTAGGAEGRQEAAAAQYGANKKFNEERPLLDKNNGEGEPKPRQPSNNLDEVYRLVEEARGEFDKYVEELQKKYGGEIKSRAELKDRGRAERKITPDNGAEEILDINGKTLVLDDLQSIVAVMQDLHGRDEVVRMKDRYKKPGFGNYRDTLTNIKMSNGAIVELQLNTKPMITAKDELGGHILYEIYEQAGNAEIDFNYAKNIADMATEGMIKLYDAAFDEALGAARHSASSLGITELFGKISEAVQEVGAGSKVLSEKTRQKLGNLCANTRSSQSKNTSSGSSKDGTSATGLEDVTLSTGAAEAGEKESSFISVPSTTSIAEKTNSVNSNSEKNSAENEKRIEKARAGWEAAERTAGEEDQITLETGTEIKGHYELGEAGISTPSVDPDADFTNSEGFPANENGTSMNVGRDYTGGFSREAAVRMAAEFDQRGMGIIVDSNGVTSSGNNRDISRRIAAKNGTDGKYIAYLKSRPERWGFTQADVAKYRHPTLYFVVSAPAAYTPLYFDQFNRSGKKGVSPLETAIKMSYLVDRSMVSEFSAAMGNYDSISELYEDTQAATEIFKSLMKKGIVTENSYPDYVESVSIKGQQRERVTSGGKDFLESVMLGAVLEEDSIRSLSLVPEIRKRVVKGLAALVDNAALGEYCVVPEINRAIAIAAEVQTNKKKYKSITDYADQTEMDLGQRVSTDIEAELAGRLLEKTEYGFADMMGGLNAVLREEAGGQSDMFGGTSKDDILRRYLGVKAKADGIRAANNKTIESGDASMAEKVEAALDNAGLARSEADGTLFQAAFHGSPHRFERFDSSHIGEGEGAQAYGWGHYFAGKKEVADWYRKTLKKKNVYIYKGEQYVESIEGNDRLYRNTEMGEAVDVGSDLYKVFNLLQTYDGDIDYVRERIERMSAAKILKEQEKDEHLAILNDVNVDEGQLYEVDIPSDEEMLDWDKRLTKKQADTIFKQLQKDNLRLTYSGPKYTKDKDYWRAGMVWDGDKMFFRNGDEFYAALIAALGSPKAASQYLRSLGVKGIRYLDGSSRAAGEGSHNYVIFDDSDVNITQTFFQLDGDLVAEAAQYDSWQEFRAAYQEKNSAILNGEPVAKVLSSDIPIIEGKPIKTALDWIKKNPIGTVETVIGDVEISPNGIRDSMSHTKYKNKVFVLPAIKPVLEKGAYLGSASDWTGKDLNNHYFAAPVYLDGERKLVFVRATEEKGTPKKFYVHEVFTEDEIKKSETPDLHSMQTSSARNASDYYRNIIHSAINVKDSFDADNAWYRSLWNDAQKIHNGTLFQEEEKTSRAGELDKRFYSEADKKYLTEALKELYRVHNDQSLEPSEEEGDAAHEEYRRIKRLEHRINTELPNAGSIIGMAAQVRSGRELSSTQYDRLKGFMRKNTRDFRAVFADIMGQEEYLEDLAETKDGEPAGRLADPRPDKQNTKARLKEIADAVRESDPALAKEIEDGTVRYDDPRIAAFEAGAESEYRESKAALDALEKETAEDFARLANDAQRRIVTAWEDVIAARVRADETDKRLRRTVEEEKKIVGPYLKQKRLEQASYEQAYKAYNALVDLHGKDADVREAVARREAKAAERERQKTLNKKRRAAKALREMKLAHLKRITRRVKFENVAYDQAVIIKTIQRIFLPSIVESGDRFVGTIDGPLLRQVWGYWQTDEEYRNALWQSVKTAARAEKLEGLLEKPWDFLTRKEKQEIIKLLPKTTVISALQLRELDAEYKADAQLDIEEKVINGEAHLIVGAELEAKVKEAVGEETYRRIQHKALEEWTPAELEELARTVDRLTVEGRRELAAKREARRNIEQRYRNMVLDMIKTGGIDIKDDDTPEEKERKKKELARIAKQGTRYQGGGRRNNLLNNFFDANLRRWTTAQDGGRKGVFTDLFYWMENDAYNKEQTRIAARRLLVETVMKEKGIRLDELYRKMEIPLFEASALFEESGRKMEPAVRKLGLPESTWNMDAYFEKRPKPDLLGTSFHDGITVDDLLYIMRGVKNEQTRKAIIYGNLSSAAERAYYKSMGNNLDEIAAYENIGYYRLSRILAFAHDFFAKPENKKFLALAEAIGKDFDQNGETLNRACIDMFDRPMWRVTDYVPMSRMEQSGEENQNRIVEDLLGIEGAGFHWAPSGFKEKRIDMSPHNQAPIKTGLYKTWAQSVTDTEHFMAYGPVVQRLNAVFKGHNAAALREALHDRWGEASVQRVDNTIANFANPNPTLQRTALDNIVRGLRGKTATAYLAWKMSGILKQMATSPWPYLQEIPPHQYLAACIEVAGGAGKVNDFIREKSIFMKNRDFDPMVKLVREAMEKNENAVLHGLDKFNAMGMKGLEWVDWVCVAPGWLATYKRELANVAKEQEAEYQRLLKKYQGSEYADVLPSMESKENKALSEVLSDEQQDTEAVARADDAVRRMQPSSRSTDIAPLFEGKSELGKALLQFQMALNVIWQNIRYDLPLAVKEKQVGTVVGMVTGYMMAGICLGMLSEIGNDDDDDEEGKLARRILFYSFTQFTDAVPVIGENVTWAAQALFTGKTRYSGQQNMIPVLEKGFGGIEKIIAAAQSEDPEKVRKLVARSVQDMGEAASILFGAPVSGIKELGRAIGIGDGDGEPDLYWQALLGQRKK